MRLLQALLALVVLVGWTAPSLAEDLVVIASSDPSVKIGAVVKGDQPLRVAADATVVLVSAAGRTLKLAGPYRSAPGTSDARSESRLVESLSRLMTQNADASAKLAAVRGQSGRAPADRPDIWGIDIAHPGRYCLRPDRDTMIWWDAARPGAIVSVMRAGNGAYQERIRWPDSKRHLPWPKKLAPADGATYVVRFRATDAGEALTTVLMPALDTDAHRAAWMAEHECTHQALKVLDALAKEAL
jgi:hypothetical protein